MLHHPIMDDAVPNHDENGGTREDPYLGQLFRDCDLDGSGYIDQNELAHICSELNLNELQDVFRELDQDGDGRISVAEFAEGFKSISTTLLNLTRKKRLSCHSLASLRSLSVSGDSLDLDKLLPDGERAEPAALDHDIHGLREGLAALSSQEQVIDLYQQIHTEHPHLLPGFEKIILDVIRDIRFHQQENERLELSYKREKEQHDRHLRHLEEEMETQMQKVEARVRKEERAKFELEKTDLRGAMEMEIQDLQNNIKQLQQVHHQVSSRDLSDEAMVAMRDRVEDLQSENRFMKSELTDAQTNLALLRSELAQLRQQYEDKVRELTNEKKTLQDYVREQENLSRQLHLLHDANKRLHDTNDDLRAAIERSRSPSRREKTSTSGSKMLDYPRGSVVGQYLDPSPIDLRRRPLSVNDEIYEPGALSARSLRMLRQKSCDRESLPEDFDSGNSTLRDLNEFDSEIEEHDTWDGDYDAQSRQRSRTNHHDPDDTEINESLDEYETEIELDMKRCLSRSSSISPSVSSRGSNRSNRSRKRRQQLSKQQGVIPKQPVILGEPERMYKVVLAGDCAVGKSSFIMRLCKDKFLANLNSTLGVDFQTKTIEVDGRIIALQLWDTAGQERFRSIAKSYFRRADGVLLLYDCTYERSFINVREWLTAIEDGTDKKIPIMMVANKVDLRPEAEAQGRRVVKEEDGNRLAKTFDGLFIESSAKNGDNILEAVTELARMLRCNEDVEVQSAALHLHAQDVAKSDRKSSSCCN